MGSNVATVADVFEQYRKLVAAKTGDGVAWAQTMLQAAGDADEELVESKPGELRRLLYLAALSAAKTKPWRPLYEHYRAKCLSSTAALVILARRIARTAWSIYTYKTEFDPARLTNPLK